ncbi:MAG: PspC domain-containing protein [Micropruina sp.]|nr:PspC domain-containing protein [Micropruina sp.]
MELTPLRRASTGAVLGGVCAALARRWQVDPTVLRIAMVLLGLLGGLGVAFYVGAVLLVPRDGSAELPLNRLLPATRSWSPAASIGAVVALGVLIVALIGSWLPLGIAPAVGLGFLWYFGFYRRRQPANPAGASPGLPSDAARPATAPLQLAERPTQTMTDFERAAAEWHQRVVEERARTAVSPDVQDGPSNPPRLVDPDVPRLVEYRPSPAEQVAATAPPPVPNWTTPVAPPAARRRPGWLWPLVLCLVGAGLAALAVASTVFGVNVPPIAYAGTVLGAFGVGLLIAAFAGRPRGILPLSVLAGLVTVAMLLPVPHAGPIGDSTYSYTTMAQLPSAAQSHGAGDITIDLAALAITETKRVEFDSGLGDVQVKLPATGNIVVEWKTAMGDYRGPDGYRDGFDLDGTYSRLTDPSGPTLTLVIRTGAGDVRVSA